MSYYRETKWYIYALIDPDDGIIKYVGQSTSPASRLQSHIHTPDSNKPKWAWIRGLYARKLRPIIKILDECDHSHVANMSEQFWIKKCLEGGCPLFNSVLPGSHIKQSHIDIENIKNARKSVSGAKVSGDIYGGNSNFGDLGCERCGKLKDRGDRYCRKCAQVVRREMVNSGYMPPAERMSRKFAPPMFGFSIITW